MLKKIAVAVVVLVLILGAGLYYGWSHLDMMVRAEIEKYGSAATQTQVKLAQVHLSLTSGEGKLGGLSVANPKGYSSAKAFDLGSIDVGIDLNSVRGTGPIVISKVIIDKPQVSYELDNGGNSNLQTLQHNAESFANSAAGNDSGAGGSTNPSTGSGSGRKIIIKDLEINNGQVSVSQSMMQGKQLSVPLPTIHLTNVGQSSGGATAAEIAQQVISSITAGASKAAIVDLAKEKINGVLKDVPVKAIGGGAADAIGNQLKGVLGQ